MRLDRTERPPVISLAGATVRIENRTILEGITLETDARRIAIVGRNGSGKTTLARLIAGLIAPTEGTARICGIDVAADRRGALGLVGILFQNPDHQIIFPTVIEEISFGLQQMGQSKAMAQGGAQAILDRFGKGHWRNTSIHTLSQGQRQLVCLMSVIAMQPRLIILDEPFAGLDIPTAMNLTRLLHGLDAQLVQITHDPSTVREYDRALWIEQGRIARDGPACDVLPAYVARMEQIGGTDDLAQLAD